MKTKHVVAIVIASVVALAITVTGLIFGVKMATEIQAYESVDNPPIEAQTVESSSEDDLTSFLRDYEYSELQGDQDGQKMFSSGVQVNPFEQSRIGDEYPRLGYLSQNFSGDGQAHDAIDLEPAIFVKGSDGLFTQTDAWGSRGDLFGTYSENSTVGTDMNGNTTAVNILFTVVAAQGEEVAVVVTDDDEAAVIYYTIGE